MCKQCINIIRNETKCPQNQISFEINHTPTDQLTINYPLLMIFYDSSKLPKDKEQRHGQCSSYTKLDVKTKSDFHTIEKFLGEISLMFKRIINDRECQLIFSRSTIRKIFNLLNIQFIDCKNHLKILKAINSLAEHICIDFIVHYQDRQQLITNIRSNIGLRDEQFVEPGMIEKILKSILLFNEKHPASSDKHLVHSVLHKISGNNPYGIVENVQSIVDVLSNACCFEMKQNGKFSSLYIKSEYEKYENLRGVFESTFIGMIVKIGLIVSSEQWSSLLGEVQILEKIDELTEQLATLREDNREQMKKLFKKQEKTQKIVYKFAHVQNHTVSRNSSSSEPLEPIIFNGHNLVDDVDMKQKPTAFLCKLVRRLYTVQEIEEGVVHDE
ncbi:unnamed protein product [Rotaria sordida]|uniref:Uncharacterized protein n=1 Tax=Rotaria sordida TaxID=392033 RepID=A0A813YXL0_9BILA|nr:unnamed protein product [Rotaria sordida]CAF0976474.1 unnamed protein product [Rotaria sordida]CAF3793893.1 unnamed protein product [Rotaria sordida]CAF3804355.1 unnamed protein product [Rotaria sordida]